MKVLSLQVENVKKIKVANITPDSDVVNVTGPNGSGKTTLFDSIEWGLGGAESIQSMPIRNGQTSARIRLDLGDIIVTRRFTEKGSTLTVENAEGARYPSPQKMLDSLFDKIGFDPLAFSRMNARDQHDELKRIAKIEVDLESLDRLNAADYEKRKDYNRAAKERATLAKSDRFTFVYPEMKSRVDLGVLAGEIAAASKRNQDLTSEAMRRKKVLGQIDSLKAEMESLERQLLAKRNEHEAMLGAKNTWKPLAEPESLDEIRQKVSEGENRNREHDRRIEQAKLLAEAVVAEACSEAFTAAMALRDQQKADAIAAAKMPIDGISLGNGVVLFNGVPFDQASSGERLRTGVAIAMAGNPKLRVCLIRDASLLDDEGMRVVTDMARERDFQVWIESVSSDGKVGIVMEEGLVAGAELPTEDVPQSGTGPTLKMPLASPRKKRTPKPKETTDAPIPGETANSDLWARLPKADAVAFGDDDDTRYDEPEF